MKTPKVMRVFPSKFRVITPSRGAYSGHQRWNPKLESPLEEGWAKMDRKKLAHIGERLNGSVCLWAGLQSELAL